jgi:hypothetical protein
VAGRALTLLAIWLVVNAIGTAELVAPGTFRDWFWPPISGVITGVIFALGLVVQEQLHGRGHRRAD